MTPFLITIRSIIAKDFRLLWPIVILSAALFAITAFLRAEYMFLRIIVEQMINLASALLIVSVVQIDTPAGLSRDWLTRPIAPSTMLLAKLLFLFVTLMVPSFASHTIQVLRAGLPLEEALFAASTTLTSAMFISVFLVAVAALTTSLLQSAGVMIALALVFLGFTAMPIGPMRRVMEGSSIGSTWVPVYGITLVAFLGSLTTLLVQYVGRRTTISRTILGGTLLLVMVTPLAFGWKTVFAIQSAVAPSQSENIAFDLIAKGECSRSGFETVLEVKGLPDGWLPMIDRIQLEHVDAEGEFREVMPENRLARPSKADGTKWAVTHLWDEEDDADESNLRLLLTLLAPDESARIALDGEKHGRPGGITCTSNPDETGKLTVLACVVPGAQPAYVTAQLDVPDSDIVSSRPPDYAPHILRNAFDNNHNLLLPLPAEGANSATVTLFEAVTHLEREVEVEMPESSCGGSTPTE